MIGVMPLSNLRRTSCLPKCGSAGANLFLAVSLGEGEARVVRLSAIAGENLALDRREVRGVLHLDEQTQHARKLERAQVGLAGRCGRGEA